MKQKNFYCTILLSLFIVSGFATGNTWGKRAAVGGSKRERCISFAIGNRGYIGLGQDTLNLMLDDFWEYDPGTNSWTQKANFPGGGRRDAACFSIGTKGYVGTGLNNADAFAGSTLNDFWEYDPATNTWTSKAAFPGSGGGGIYYTTGFAISTKGYFCCGKIGPSYYSKELWEYTPSVNSWVRKADFPNGVRYGGVAFTIGNIAYFGTGTDENIFCSDFCKYDPATNMWTPVSSLPGSPRFSCSGFTLEGLGYVLFGSDGGYKDELWQYDPSYDYWYTKANFTGGARRSAAAFCIGNRAFAGVGKGLTGTRRDFWEYVPSAPVGITENDQVLSSVYPNPFTEELHVTVSSQLFQQHHQLEFFLSDLSGRIVAKSAIEAENFIVNRNDLPAGIYFLAILTDHKIIAGKKIIIS